MSIGKRLIDLAKSELNSLLERAARDDDDEPSAPRAPRGRVRLEDLSDADLEAEIERRRLDRELEDRTRRNAGTGRTGSGTASAGTSGSTAGGRASGAGRTAGAQPRRSSVPGDPVARAYAALELPPGSDFEAVRKSYRAMMRKYHPDRHTASPEKQKAANELAQKLTESYKILEKRLRR